MAYIPRPDAFKHYTYGKYKVDFYKSTAIIKWTDKVGDDYDEKPHTLPIKEPFQTL